MNEENYGLTPAGKRENKKMMVERQWVLLDTIKSLRLKTALIMNGLSIAITGFVIKNELFVDGNYIFCIALIPILISFFGCIITIILKKQYDYRDDVISSLYIDIGVTSNNDINNNDINNNYISSDSGSVLFIIMYSSYCVIAILCSSLIILTGILNKV